MSQPSESNLGASHVKRRLHAKELLVLLLIILTNVPLILSKISFDILRGNVSNRESLLMSIVRGVSILAPKLPIEIAQAIQAPTGDTMAIYCKKHRLHCDIRTLHPQGGDFPAARLFHLEADSQSTGGVLLYAHGGGYIGSTSPGTIQVALDLAKSLGCRQLSFLEYTLAPAARYPSQLAQGVEALAHLLQDHDAASIVIAGDSAGANLMLGLTAHLRTPHPEIRSDVKLKNNLAALICISPRCSNATTAPSFALNGPRDVLRKQTCEFFVDTWQPVPGHVWAASNNGDSIFWRDVKVDKVLLLAGEFECYVDDIKAFATIIGASESSSADRQFHIAKGAMHDQLVIDQALRIQDGSMNRLLFQWATNNRLHAL
jgi:acetyl esterase/lipase